MIQGDVCEFGADELCDLPLYFHCEGEAPIQEGPQPLNMPQ